MVAAAAASQHSEDELTYREMALKWWRCVENCEAQTCAALGHLATVQIKLGEREEALSNWREQLEMARQLQLGALQAEACAGLGRAFLRSRHESNYSEYQWHTGCDSQRFF